METMEENCISKRVLNYEIGMLGNLWRCGLMKGDSNGDWTG